MQNTILITGANSFIAQHLIPILQKSFYIKLLSRTPKQPNEYRWNIEADYIDDAALDDVDFIIHLAGSKLNDGTPLTEARKKTVYQSRIGGAQLILKRLKERNQNITSFISASAIGYYGFTDRQLKIDELGAKGNGFAAQLTEDWEKAADLFKDEIVAEHVAKIRVSLVLGNEGGIFPTMVNSVLNNFDLYKNMENNSFPWNHVENMAGIFAFAVMNNLDGVFNSVAPEAASSKTIYQLISNEIQKKITRVEPFHGQHLIAQKIIDAGYQFKYPTITQAIQHLIQTK